MYYLKNQGGRIISIDKKEDYEKFLTLGFTVPTRKEKDEYQQRRIQDYQSKAFFKGEPEKVNNDRRVYIATVVTGGKDGYGIASDKVINGLKRLDVDISTTYDNQKVGILFHNPYSVLKMENPYRIIYTMFESTKIPDDWKEYLDSADKVLVPSKWCQEVFKKSGVESTVIPLGFDNQVFKYYERMNKRKANKDFIFLHYNAFNIRKGFLELFKAFTQEFQKDEPVRLVLKTNLRSIPIPINKAQYPNIDIIHEEMPEKDLVSLIQKSDCFVFPSRGEGFGMTPLECMATGMPAIVPNAHGITEYFNPDYMYEVKVKEMCPGIYSRYKNQDVGEMYVNDVDDLRKQMRYVYEHQDEALEKGRKASEYVKKWTFENTCIKLKGILEEAFLTKTEDRQTKNILQLREVK